MADDTDFNTSAISAGKVLEERFEIVRRISTGGTGVVYQAKDLEQGDSPVAVKVLHSTHLKNESIVARFVQEATLLNNIDHKNIVKTRAISVKSDMIFLVTEYIVGRTLAETIDASDNPYEVLPDIIKQICEGLKVVHDLGILHRDLKPENILLQDDGLVKIIDFGAARSPKSQLTLAGQLIGTTPYIAPEVWIEKELTPAIDFYSLGVILYQVTTKKLPFDKLNASDLMRLHLRADPVVPQTLVLDIPDWLNHLIMKLLEKRPASRFVKADQIISFLQNVEDNNFTPTQRSSFKSLSASSTESPPKKRSRGRVRKKRSLLSKFLSRFG